MKKFLSIAILFVGLFTLNAQADEILDHADMLNTPFVELSELATLDNTIEFNDHNQRLDLYDLGDSGHALSIAQGGQYKLADLDLSIEGTTTPYITNGGSDFIVTSERRPITSLMSLRGTGEGSSDFKGNDNPPEGNDSTLRGDSDPSREKQGDRLACTCKVGHCRPYRT